MKLDYSLVYFNLKNKFSNDYSYIPIFDFGNSGICSRISDMEKYNYNKINTLSYNNNNNEIKKIMKFLS